MRAAICTRYGAPDVIQIRNAPNPQPKPDQVLVEIHATCVNSGDARIRALRVPAGMKPLVRLGFGMLRPRKPILGTDFAGEVSAVGDQVRQFKSGDKVFGSCGLNMGAHAEFAVVDFEGLIALKPETLSMTEAASLVFGGLTAVSFLRDKAKMKPGERVLINGATGSVGCASIQIAKHLGAIVTAVCSAESAWLAQSLGADRIIDYRKEDFTQNEETYDVIMDNVGNASWPKSKHSLAEGGRLLRVVAGLTGMLAAFLRPERSNRKIIAGMSDDTRDGLDLVARLANAGKFKPVIDRVLQFEDIVEAHRVVDSGHKKGSVVLKLRD